jgi:hypothetical protein
LGPTSMIEDMLWDLEDRCVVAPGFARFPPKTEVYAAPKDDKVVVFKDFFAVGLRFPLDPAVVEIFRRYGVYLHQMTPNSFIWLSLFMWLAKTCRIAPTVENFAWVSRVHYQPKTIVIRGSDGQSTEVDPNMAATPSLSSKPPPAPSPPQRINGRGTGPRAGCTTKFPSTQQRSATSLW